MIRLDHKLLAEVGLELLPEDFANDLLRHIYETLEMRVGLELADQMTQGELDEFEKFFETGDDAGAFRWLETNFPNYKQVVAEQFGELKVEIAANADAILASA